MENFIERLKTKKWGVFHHYLRSMFTDPQSFRNLNFGAPDWNGCVELFDTEKLAYSLNKMGAGYYFITLMQGSEYMMAPNETFDKIAGTKPGEACSRRDLPLDLYKSLSKYDIDLCLYYTGDGPHRSQYSEKFGHTFGKDKFVSREFVEKWASVLEEYSERYGDKVKAWWIDGAYIDALGYNEDLFSLYHNAIHKGEPRAAVAFNNGYRSAFGKTYSKQEFSAGEFNYFGPTPTKEEAALTVPHTLTPLGYTPGGEEWQGYGARGVKYTPDFAIDYIQTINKMGGIVTIDAAANIDGSFDPEQEGFLRYVGARMRMRTRTRI